MEKIKLGVSSCLLGENVRYDGGHKLDHFLTDTLGAYVDWVLVCPEVEIGLPVPRDAMHLVGDVEAPRLVTIRTGVDHTSRMRQWAKKKVTTLAAEDLCGFVFKSRSPSSGMRGVKIYSPEGIPISTGAGIFAKAFQERFPLLPVEDEGRLHDPGLRENFIEGSSYTNAGRSSWQRTGQQAGWFHFTLPTSSWSWRTARNTIQPWASSLQIRNNTSWMNCSNDTVRP